MNHLNLGRGLRWYEMPECGRATLSGVISSEGRNIPLENIPWLMTDSNKSAITTINGDYFNVCSLWSNDRWLLWVSFLLVCWGLSHSYYKKCTTILAALTFWIFEKKSHKWHLCMWKSEDNHRGQPCTLFETVSCPYHSPPLNYIISIKDFVRLYEYHSFLSWVW